MRILLKYSFVFLCFAVTGCKTRQHLTIKEKPSYYKPEYQNHFRDTLREPTHYYYLADIDPKVLAELILNDSINPSDNFYTFRIMDSINSISYSDRQFYLKAFINIMDKADGALAEAVLSPARAYIELHSKEFFEINPPLSKEQFNRWANYVGDEIYLSSNNDEKENGERFINLITTNCSDCSTETKRKVKEFCTIVMKSINNLKE